MLKTCKTCNLPKDKETEFPSTGWFTRKDGSRLRTYKPDCKSCHVANQLTRFEQLFEELGIEFKCVRCGYNRYAGNIDFHHKDPAEKDFTIAMRPCVSKEKLQKEINKCIIVCKICHGELHAGLWQLSELGL